MNYELNAMNKQILRTEQMNKIKIGTELNAMNKLTPSSRHASSQPPMQASNV
jgi:hypothetical protein